MVEVFASNVNSVAKAEEIVELLHQQFSGYKINFDLDDCDNIMRVESVNVISAPALIDFLAGYDVNLETLK